MQDRLKDPEFVTKVSSIMFEGQKMLNFADYLFLRRADLAWQKCAVD